MTTLAMVQAISYASMVNGEYVAKFGIKGFTDKAICVEFSDNQFVWMPLSQIFFTETAAGLYVCMPVWLARKNGFSYVVSSDQELNNNVHKSRASYVAVIDNGTLSSKAIKV